MSYDFHGAFEPFVGHCAPLYASSLDVTDEQKEINVVSDFSSFVYNVILMTSHFRLLVLIIGLKRELILAK